MKQLLEKEEIENFKKDIEKRKKELYDKTGWQADIKMSIYKIGENCIVYGCEPLLSKSIN